MMDMMDVSLDASESNINPEKPGTVDNDSHNHPNEMVPHKQEEVYEAKEKIPVFSSLTATISKKVAQSLGVGWEEQVSKICMANSLIVASNDSTKRWAFSGNLQQLQEVEEEIRALLKVGKSGVMTTEDFPASAGKTKPPEKEAKTQDVGIQTLRVFTLDKATMCSTSSQEIGVQCSRLLSRRPDDQNRSANLLYSTQNLTVGNGVKSSRKRPLDAVAGSDMNSSAKFMRYMSIMPQSEGIVQPQQQENQPDLLSTWHSVVDPNTHEVHFYETQEEAHAAVQNLQMVQQQDVQASEVSFFEDGKNVQHVILEEVQDEEEGTGCQDEVGAGYSDCNAAQENHSETQVQEEETLEQDMIVQSIHPEGSVQDGQNMQVNTECHSEDKVHLKLGTEDHPHMHVEDSATSDISLLDQSQGYVVQTISIPQNAVQGDMLDQEGSVRESGGKEQHGYETVGIVQDQDQLFEGEGHYVEEYQNEVGQEDHDQMEQVVTCEESGHPIQETYYGQNVETNSQECDQQIEVSEGDLQHTNTDGQPYACTESVVSENHNQQETEEVRYVSGDAQELQQWAETEGGEMVVDENQAHEIQVYSDSVEEGTGAVEYIIQTKEDDNGEVHYIMTQADASKADFVVVTEEAVVGPDGQSIQLDPEQKIHHVQLDPSSGNLDLLALLGEVAEQTQQSEQALLVEQYHGQHQQVKTEEGTDIPQVALVPKAEAEEEVEVMEEGLLENRGLNKGFTKLPSLKRGRIDRTPTTLKDTPYKRHLGKVQNEKGQWVHQCQLCCFQAKKMYYMHRHMLLHQQGKHLYKCKFCDYSTLHSGQVARHELLNHSQLIYACEECSYRTNTKERMNYHARVKHKAKHNVISTEPPKIYHCPICDYKASRESFLQSHLKTHQICDGAEPGDASGLISIFKCSYCPYETNTKKLFKVHLYGMHECWICGLVCDKKKDLIAHRSNHTKDDKLLCEICGKDFENMGKLELHSKVHSGEYDLFCDECGMPFSSQTTLNMHRKKMHSERKVMSCPHCTKTFLKEVCLKFHIEKQHVEAETLKRVDSGEAAGVVILNCEHCEYRTHSQNLLFRHIRRVHRDEDTVEGESMYECQVCGWRTIMGSTFVRHLATHGIETNVKEEMAIPVLQNCVSYQCTLCSYVTEVKADYDEHLDTVHRCAKCKEVYPTVEERDMHATTCDPAKQSLWCRLCNLNYTSEREYSSHLRMKHGFRAKKGKDSNTELQEIPTRTVQKEYITLVSNTKKYLSVGNIGESTRKGPGTFKTKIYIKPKEKIQSSGPSVIQLKKTSTKDNGTRYVEVKEMPTVKDQSSEVQQKNISRLSTVMTQIAPGTQDDSVSGSIEMKTTSGSKEGNVQEKKVKSEEQSEDVTVTKKVESTSLISSGKNNVGIEIKQNANAVTDSGTNTVTYGDANTNKNSEHVKGMEMQQLVESPPIKHTKSKGIIAINTCETTVEKRIIIKSASKSKVGTSEPSSVETSVVDLSPKKSSPAPLSTRTKSRVSIETSSKHESKHSCPTKTNVHSQTKNTPNAKKPHELNATGNTKPSTKKQSVSAKRASSLTPVRKCKGDSNKASPLSEGRPKRNCKSTWARRE